MPFLLDAGAKLACPHGAQITVQGSAGAPTLSGQPAVRVTDPVTITGCKNNPPCEKLVWQGGSTRVQVQGVQVVLASSKGLCLAAGGIANGDAVLIAVQTRVAGF